MKRIVLILCLTLFSCASTSAQERGEIIREAIRVYEKNLTEWKMTIFKEFRKRHKPYKVSKLDYHKYKIIIVPTYKFNASLNNLEKGQSLLNHIDFNSIFRGYSGYVFKDSVFVSKVFYEKGWIGYYERTDMRLVKLLSSFKPDMVFYPSCATLLCSFKDGKFFISEMIKNGDECTFLEEDEFNRAYPSRLSEFSTKGFFTTRRYKILE